MAALRILKHTKEGDNIVIFGNSPYFIGRALKLIMAHKPEIKRNIIDLPFSGAPNRGRVTGNAPSRKDIVTTERLNHLKERLKAAGLMADNAEKLINTTTHFVDLISSGSGPAYAIEVILRDFKENKVKEAPDIQLINLSKLIIVQPEEGEAIDTRAKSIVTKSARDDENVMIHFPSIKETHFKVPTKIIYMEGHRSFDVLPGGTSLRALPEYNASYWTEEYDYLLTQERPYHMKILFQHFDTNIEARINK